MAVRVLYFRLKFDLIILDFHINQINLIVKIKYNNQKLKIYGSIDLSNQMIEYSVPIAHLKLLHMQDQTKFIFIPE